MRSCPAGPEGRSISSLQITCPTSGEPLRVDRAPRADYGRRPSEAVRAARPVSRCQENGRLERQRAEILRARAGASRRLGALRGTVDRSCALFCDWEVVPSWSGVIIRSRVRRPKELHASTPNDRETAPTRTRDHRNSRCRPAARPSGRERPQQGEQQLRVAQAASPRSRCGLALAAIVEAKQVWPNTRPPRTRYRCSATGSSAPHDASANPRANQAAHPSARLGLPHRKIATAAQVAHEPPTQSRAHRRNQPHRRRSHQPRPPRRPAQTQSSHRRTSLRRPCRCMLRPDPRRRDSRARRGSRSEEGVGASPANGQIVAVGPLRCGVRPRGRSPLVAAFRSQTIRSAASRPAVSQSIITDTARPASNRAHCGSRRSPRELPLPATRDRALMMSGGASTRTVHPDGHGGGMGNEPEGRPGRLRAPSAHESCRDA